MYEAWTVYLAGDYDEPRFTKKFCGMTTIRGYDSYPGVVSSISELYDQKELMDMHIKSLETYKSKHKRSWTSRLVRSGTPSYEDDIDGRIRKLPNHVQSEICRLLSDREEASSNRYHNRPWTVVMMQEQLHRRFADANPKVIDKRHKVRFWKNPGKHDRSEYFVIIRGREGERIADPKGQCEFKRFENPWQHVDDAETRRKTRERYAKLNEKRGRTMHPPSYRYSPSPPPPSPPPPRQTFPGRSMYAAPGAYSRPHIGMPSGPRIPPPPPDPTSYYRSYQYPPPPAPTPPVSCPPPPPVQYARGIADCFRGPKYPVSAPDRPTSSYPSTDAGPPAPRASTMYAPPSHPHPPPRPGTQTFGSYSSPYTTIHCGGPYNASQDKYYPPATPPPPPAPGASAPLPPPSFPLYPYATPRPGNRVPAVNWPARVISISEPNPVSGTAYGSVGSLMVGESHGLDESEDEYYVNGMDLCGDADGAASVRSRLSAGRETVSDEEKGKGEVKEEEDPERTAQQEELRRQMGELIEANKRRNEEGARGAGGTTQVST